MKYIVAVSGGVDSMVLLDMMARLNDHQVVVAHFDHGIREDSHLDEQFVRETAERYGLLFESRRENLGSRASEALARERRYAFLSSLAEEHEALLVTAHHLDDLVESVAINVTRGTGWRGLAALDSGVLRPLLDMDKRQLLEYAQKNNVAWREDSTNASDAYLRNRIRKRAADSIEHTTKRELRALHAHQKALRRDIEQEVKKLVGDGPLYSRYFFTNVPPVVAAECLRYITSGKLTRPQLLRAVHAIKVASPRSIYEAGSGVKLHFSTRQFSL